MKKAVLVLMATFIMMLPGTVWAMQFSQPVKLGYVQTKDGIHWFASGNMGSSSIENTYYDFGCENKNIIRLHVKGKERVGSTSDIKNVVECYGGAWIGLYEIPNDKNIPIYVIMDQNQEGRYSITVIGKENNGRFFQYIGMDGFKKAYNYDKFELLGIKCKISADNNVFRISCQNSKTNWEYILKWDDSAQWFGIDTKDL